MNQMPPDLASKEPAKKAEAMTAALIALRKGISVTSGLRLEDYPKANRKSAADRLGSASGRTLSSCRVTLPGRLSDSLCRRTSIIRSR